ncbi:MAG: RNA methyltransferase [Chloroflexaceae bacterium]
MTRLDQISLDNVIIVLHQPRDVVNIGGVVRAMKNMGLRHLRLVAPAPFDPADLTGIAHRSEDILATMGVYADLNAALADVTYVVGTSARAHADHPVRSDIRSLAPELLARATTDLVALLFGPEDNGLDNAALDRCHLVLRLPTDPAYPSLNLAQAVLLLLYELRMAATVAAPSPSAPASPATAAQLETLFATWEEALQAVEFFKTGRRTGIMRRLRRLFHRADPTGREAALLTAIAREVVQFLRRKA